VLKPRNPVVLIKMTAHKPDSEKNDNASATPKLTPRQRDVLAIVVRDYTKTAMPVGSTAIVREYPLGVSSATVRNELAYLEEQGYLTHPHTSAGRVPTEKGYRYFVAQLMQETDLPLAEQRMIRHQFHQVRMDLEQWMRLTATVLAHTARAASMVTAPHAPQTRLKHLKLISVSDALGLLVLVLHGGTVRQELISLTSPIFQDEMEAVANKLNALLQGLSAAEIEGSNYVFNPLERLVLDRMLDIMWEEERHRSVTLYRDGLSQVLQQPEFAEASRARHVVRVLEEGSLLGPMLMAASERRGVQVIIGGEGYWEGMGGYGIVISRYGVWGHASGALGVLGPLRMSYRRAVSAVRYVSLLLSELVGELYEE